MLKIRPHHILCMRAYSGNGYSQAFKDSMEAIIKDIKAYNEFLNTNNNEDEIKKVEIVYSTDSICEKCNNKLGENRCSSQDKVSIIDRKLSKYFNLKEGIYNYKELEERKKYLEKNNNGMSWYLSFKEPKEECQKMEKS